MSDKPRTIYSAETPRVPHQSYGPVYDFLSEALAKWGHTLRPPGSGGWYRFPAVWRNSADRNIAANENGIVYDHTKECHLTLQQLGTLLQVPEGGVPVQLAKGLHQIENTGDRIRAAVNYWKNSAPLSEASLNAPEIMASWTYLERRGFDTSIINLVAKNIRATKDEFGPILVYPIWAPNDTGPMILIGVQRKFLNWQGEDRPGLEASRMMLGMQRHNGKSGWCPITGGPSEYGQRAFAVAEGYENGLAVRALTGMPAYVAWNAGGIENISLTHISAQGATRLIVAEDLDPPKEFAVGRGRRASLVLGKRMMEEAQQGMDIATPPMGFRNEEGYADWNMVYKLDKENGAEIFRESLKPYDPKENILIESRQVRNWRNRRTEEQTENKSYPKRDIALALEEARELVTQTAAAPAPAPEKKRQVFSDRMLESKKNEKSTVRRIIR